jgi:hypothetical protein
MQVSLSMYDLGGGEVGLSGWMQSTGQTATQAVSLVPMQGSAIMWAMMARSLRLSQMKFSSRIVRL